MRVGLGARNHEEAVGGVGGDDFLRGVDIDAHEVQGCGDGFQFFGRKLRGVRTEGAQVEVGVAALEDDGGVGRVDFAEGDFRGVDMLGVDDGGHGAGHVLRESHLDGARGRGANGLDSETMGEDGVVAGSGDIAAGQPQPGGDSPEA